MKHKFHILSQNEKKHESHSKAPAYSKDFRSKENPHRIPKGFISAALDCHVFVSFFPEKGRSKCRWVLFNSYCMLAAMFRPRMASHKKDISSNQHSVNSSMCSVFW